MTETTHNASGITFGGKNPATGNDFKGKISLVGPIIGSGANGEGGKLLLKSDEQMTCEKKVILFKSLADNGANLSQEMLKSLANKVATLMSELTGEPVVPPSPQLVSNSDDGGIVIETPEEEVEVTDSHLVASKVAASAAPSESAAAISLVKGNKTMKEEKTVEEQLKELKKSQADTLAKLESVQEANKGLLLDKEESNKKIELKKAEGFSVICGEDGVAALGEAFYAVSGLGDTAQPIISALNKALGMLKNSKLLEEQGTNSEDKTLLVKSQDKDEKVQKMFTELKKSHKELSAQDIYQMIWESNPELK